MVEVQGNITAQENGIVVYQKNTDILYNNWNDMFCAVALNGKADVHIV